MVALGRGNSPHLATWATPPAIDGASHHQSVAPGTVPSLLAARAARPGTPASWRSRSAGSRSPIPHPHSPGRPPLASRAARILAARTTPQLRGPWRPWNRKPGANDEDLRTVEAATALRGARSRSFRRLCFPPTRLRATEVSTGWKPRPCGAHWPSGSLSRALGDANPAPK